MGLRGMNWQKLQIPFSAGLNQRSDDRARPQPFLDVCVDAQFDETDGLQTRLPFGAAEGDIFGGGTIANPRRIERNGTELVLFTSDKLYSWNEQLSKWVLRSTHLAVDVEERSLVVTTGDQINGDRAELGGTVVYTWAEGSGASRGVFVAAVDKATGAVLLAPTGLSGATYILPRVIALTTRILLFAHDISNNLVVFALDPASPGTGIAAAATSVLAGVSDVFYDVAKSAASDSAVVAIRRVVTTSYTVAQVTAGLAVTTSTKARTCTGVIAISAAPSGTHLQIIRTNGANIQGDLLLTSFTDVITAQAIGSGSPNQIAACHRSVTTGGAHRCYVFWSTAESDSDSQWVSQFNFVDTAGAIGTAANFIRHLGVATRAFDHNGSVFVWMVFAGATTFNGTSEFAVPAFSLQNTYFLYRDDATLHGKAIAGRGGGFVPSQGHLPGVALIEGATRYAWCGTTRRRIELNGVRKVGFAARAPVDVVITFDSNLARRCARIGGTLYIAGGEILQYDGVRLVECGHHIYPWIFSMIDAAAGGSVGLGTYAYKITWRYQNAQGELDRSTTATIGQVTVTGNSVLFPAPFAPLTVTHKTAVPPAVEVWRTQVDPVPESPFFLVTSSDPAALANPNRYIPNVPTLGTLGTFTDFLSDDDASTAEANPENGAVLENLAPPGARIIIATDTRLLLAGVSGDPDRVWYSRLRNAGEVASFHDILTVSVPREGGAITSIVVHDGVLYAFRATALYALPGEGLNNLGEGQNYGPARIISLDVGALAHEAVAITPTGVMFKSRKGWYLLRSNGDVQYIGDKVSDYDDEEVLSISVIETQHQVRILLAARMLVWDYRENQWGEWSITDGLYATIYDGSHVYLATGGTRTQLETYTGLTYGLDEETAWIKLADLQGATAVRRILALGQLMSACLVRVRLAYDYREEYVDDKLWTPPDGAVGKPMQISISPKFTKCQSIKVRLTAVTAGLFATVPTLGGFDSDLVTLSGAWDAELTTTVVGVPGDLVTMSVGFEQSPDDSASVDVRDHFRWSHTNQQWEPAVNNIGILCLLGGGDELFVGDIEFAINEGSALCAVTTGHPIADTVVAATMLSQIEITAAFGGGTFVPPTGEAIKLTALGLEVGIEPGLFKRLPAAQKV